MLKQSLILSISFLLIGIGIGISLVNWTNAEDNPDPDPTTEHATVIEDLPEYTGVFDKAATGMNYLKNANFYSEGKSYEFRIDTSLIDRVGFAIYWYDKVITEFPNTPAANRALRDKMKTILGWTEGFGDDKKYYGLTDRNLNTSVVYFQKLIVTYAKFERDYPDDPYLQAFAFQIAQKYWYYLLTTNNSMYTPFAEKWMKKTIELSDGKDTFYSQIAKRRLRDIAAYK